MREIAIDVGAKSESYAPIWKKMITAGRAAEGLRDDWRRQLAEVQREIGFEYIRFHGLFHDDMFIYNERSDGTVFYNWQYLDSLFDYLRSIGLKPFVELGFMPSALASGTQTMFWWKANVTPPKDYGKWTDLVSETVKHCVNRYGREEVAAWYFEVWNEPDYEGFWSGDQAEYFKLYEASVRGVKAIDPRFKVGGPSTTQFKQGQAPWLEAFLAYCASRELPVDFITNHPYPNDLITDLEGHTPLTYRGEESTADDLRWLRAAVARSSYPLAEIHPTEWNTSFFSRDLVHDTAFMAPYVIQNNVKSIGTADSLGFWTFSDVFEEMGAGETLFHGGFGMMTLQGLKKPSYYGYWFLARLGSERLASGDGFFAARKGDRVQVLLWNYAHYGAAFATGDSSALKPLDRYSIFDGVTRRIVLSLSGARGRHRILTYRFGREHGSAYDEWLANGALSDPTAEELSILECRTGPQGSIDTADMTESWQRELSLAPHDVVLVEFIPEI